MKLKFSVYHYSITFSGVGVGYTDPGLGESKDTLDICSFPSQGSRDLTQVFSLQDSLPTEPSLSGPLPS